jgi:hypothetical protein
MVAIVSPDYRLGLTLGGFGFVQRLFGFHSAFPAESPRRIPKSRFKCNKSLLTIFIFNEII